MRTSTCLKIFLKQILIFGCRSQEILTLLLTHHIITNFSWPQFPYVWHKETGPDKHCSETTYTIHVLKSFFPSQIKQISFKASKKFQKRNLKKKKSQINTFNKNRNRNLEYKYLFQTMAYSTAKPIYFRFQKM